MANESEQIQQIQQIQELLQPYIGKKCVIEVNADNPFYHAPGRVEVAVIDWTDDDATGAFKYDILDDFEDADGFSEARMRPFGLMGGRLQWFGILLFDLTHAAPDNIPILYFSKDTYRFSDLAASISDLGLIVEEEE